MSQENTQPINALKVLAGAFAIVPLNLHVFARTLAIPFILLLIYDSVTYSITFQNLYAERPWLFLPIMDVTAGALYTIVAVITHRTVLLGAESVPTYGLEWRPYTMRFFGWVILLSVLLAVSFVAIVLLAALWLPLALLAGLALVYSASRFLLVYPASAIGEPMSLKRSWELTSHHKALMFLIAFIFPSLLALPFSWIPGDSALGVALLSLTSSAVLVVTVILLSFAYQQIQRLAP